VGSLTRLVVLTSGTDLGVGYDAAPPWFVLAAWEGCKQQSACRSRQGVSTVWLVVVDDDHSVGR